MFFNIPVATAGGVIALLVTGIHFSVSAAMGFISIFGIAVQDAILVVTYFQRLRNVEGMPVLEAAREASEKRLRPCLMTTLVAMIGLFPAAVSNGHRLADAEAARRRGHRRRVPARGRGAGRAADAAGAGARLVREAGPGRWRGRGSRLGASSAGLAGLGRRRRAGMHRTVSMTRVLDSSGPRFDESLASVARGLHVAPVAMLALAAGAALFLWLERRGRGRWTQVPASTQTATPGPYRQSQIVSAHLERAPRLVRAAAFANLVFAHAFAPLILLALTQYPFDGIAIPLVPGMALVVLNWACAWLLLGRSRDVRSTVRSGAVASLIANVGLLLIAAAHFAVVEAQREEGIRHACSTSVTFVVIVFASASLLLSLLTLAALRVHHRELGWTAA